ncbi:hypothetical protein PLICRDRAFT_167211 [Plicaturopsis crispa FD-325 SS-3]|uniref:MFS general substrate transporter n=1 Tax=Plicaturopsis crispa FD-325 SS-3 TaxID=944288 RepID=A0A0C9SRN1_PLICR|nr:hypothetical protein PLICRDRAFT_167211 [Plicaturopsis crispa FD-325 SS-3]
MSSVTSSALKPEDEAKGEAAFSTDVVVALDDIPESEREVVLDTVEAYSQYTPAEYKKLLRKVDWVLLPLMWILYGTQQADKTSTSTQATFGLRTDTHLVGQQFSWLSTAFYLSYLVSEFPGNYVMQRVNIGTTLACVMFVWGVIVLCIAFAKNFTDLIILRVLQGAAECTISPAFLIITGAWYTTKEHTLRAIIWGTANAGFGIITSFANYGIGSHAQAHPGGLAPWKGISFFLGSLTIFLSFFAFFFLGTPREVRWLSKDEKRMAAARVVSNQTGSDRQKRGEWKWDQFWMTWRDPQTYFFFFVTLVNSLPNGGTTSFGNLVYVSFGFTSLETLSKGTVPQNIVSVAWFLLVGYITFKRKNLRFAFMMISVVPAFIGMLAMGLLPAGTHYRWIKWGMFLMTVTGNLPGLLIWTFLPSNVAGRTKKSVTATVLFVAYCAGNAIGAQIFQAKDAPRYTPALITCAAMYGLEFVLMGSWRAYYAYKNAQRRRAIAAKNLTQQEIDQAGRLNAEADMTDFENEFFLYDI